MAIKIEMLRCFKAVVEQGSLAEAANTLGRTPSAVSMMLKQFEDRVGAPLFETSRKSRPTPLGEMIYSEACNGLRHFERATSAIEGLSRAETGHLRLAVTPSIAAVILPPIISRFTSDYPKVRLELRDMDSAAVQRELVHERADIGLATIGPCHGLDRRKLFSDEFGVVCRADHSLAQSRSPLRWSQIAEHTLIANGLCSLINDNEFAAILRAAHLMVPNMVSLLGLIKAGAGFTILPRLAVLPDYDGLAFIPLAGTTARREVHLITQPHHMLTPPARAFVAAIRTARVRATPERDTSNPEIQLS